MKQTFYPLALGLLLVSSCGKDKSGVAPVPEGEYESAATILAAPITMYTKDGAVNDPAIVDRYLNRRPSTASFFSRTATPVLYNIKITLRIKGNSKVDIITVSSGRNDTLETDITSQSSQYLVLSLKDTVKYASSGSASDRCERWGNVMLTDYPKTYCANVAQPSGNFQVCKFRPSRLVKLQDGALYIPQLSTSSKIRGASSNSFCSQAQAGTWNLFNLACLNQLIAGDTIVVQERQIALSKK